MNEQNLTQLKEFIALLREHPELRAEIKELLTAPEPLPDETREHLQTTE